MANRGREIEQAIARELEEWPGATYEFKEGAKHPRVKLKVGELIQSVSYPGTPGTVQSMIESVAKVRRALRGMGAERNRPEPSREEEVAAYRPPNDGKAKRPNPVKREPVRQQPDLVDQLVEQGVAERPAEDEQEPIRWRRLDLQTGEVQDGEGLIDQPGVYQMDEATYHGDPCVEPSCSASLLKKALPGSNRGGSPRHMQFAHPRLTPLPPEEDQRNKFDLGSAFHSMLLGEGAELVIVDADAWTTKAARQEREDAYAAGQQPILRSQYERAQQMLAAADAQIGFWPDLARAMADGWAEVVLIWIEETPSGPVFCRCKLDWLPKGGNLFPDWKTTEASAGPDDYGRVMFDVGADVQQAFYQRGVKAVLNRDMRMIFPCIETYQPHAMMVHDIDPTSSAMGDRKVQWGLNIYAMCLARNYWPAYPNEIATQSAPPWIESKWLDREDAGVTDPMFTMRLIDQMADMKKRGTTHDKEFAEDFDLEAKED